MFFKTAHSKPSKFIDFSFLSLKKVTFFRKSLLSYNFLGLPSFVLYHECLISEWIAYMFQKFLNTSSDISSLPVVIPMTGLFAPHISSVVSKVIWGDKEVSAGAIC